MEVINHLKYPLMNPSIVDGDDQLSKVPFEESFGG
jgi:hypothetical protein